MTVFVIAIGILALLSAGAALAFAAAGYTREKTSKDYGWEAVAWLAVAGGAAYVLLA